jgi:hypothetical protein
MTLLPATQSVTAGGVAFASVHAQIPATSAPIANKPVSLTITGPNAQVLPGTTDANGNAVFTYTPATAGTDNLLASVSQAGAGMTAGVSGTVTVTAASSTGGTGGTGSPTGGTAAKSSPPPPTCSIGALKPKQAGGRAVSLGVTCNEAAALSVSGTATPPATKHGRHGKSKKAKSLQIGAVTGNAIVNVPLTLTIPLPGAAGAALAGGGTVKLNLVLVARNVGGLSSQTPLSQSVKGARKKASHKRRR